LVQLNLRNYLGNILSSTTIVIELLSYLISMNLKYRKVIGKIKLFLDKKNIIILHGSRQVGKTSIMRYLINNYLINKEIHLRSRFRQRADRRPRYRIADEVR